MRQRTDAPALHAVLLLPHTENVMPHFYDGYHLIGVHLMWWIFWILFISIMFGAYQPIRRNRGKKKEEVISKP